MYKITQPRSRMCSKPPRIGLKTPFYFYWHKATYVSMICFKVNVSGKNRSQRSKKLFWYQPSKEQLCMVLHITCYQNLQHQKQYWQLNTQKKLHYLTLTQLKLKHHLMFNFNETLILDLTLILNLRAQKPNRLPNWAKQNHVSTTNNS